MIIRHGDYTLTLAGSLPERDVLSLAELVISQKLDPDTIYRNSRRTFIARFNYAGNDLVLKIPRGRNRRYWERFLSIIRKGESTRVFDSLLKLQQLNFTGPVPVLAAERRSLGVVVDSFIIYEYLDGDKAEAEDAQKVVDTLIALHETGYIRRDARLPNFLIGDYGVALIDFRLKRPRFLPQLQLHIELAQFLNNSPRKNLQLPQNITHSFWFKLAMPLQRITSGSRRIRRRLKKLLKA